MSATTDPSNAMSPSPENLLLQHREVVAVMVSSGAFFAALYCLTWVIS